MPKLTANEIAAYNAESFADRAKRFAWGLGQQVQAIADLSDLLRKVEAGEPVSHPADALFGVAIPVTLTADDVKARILEAVRAAERYAASHRNFADLV